MFCFLEVKSLDKLNNFDKNSSKEWTKPDFEEILLKIFRDILVSLFKVKYNLIMWKWPIINSGWVVCMSDFQQIKCIPPMKCRNFNITFDLPNSVKMRRYWFIFTEFGRSKVMLKFRHFIGGIHLICWKSGYLFKGAIGHL
jgi:hypothetical protein